jgi:hypothetical protein
MPPQRRKDAKLKSQHRATQRKYTLEIEMQQFQAFIRKNGIW